MRMIYLTEGRPVTRDAVELRPRADESRGRLRRGRAARGCGARPWAPGQPRALSRIAVDASEGCGMRPWTRQAEPRALRRPPASMDMDAGRAERQTVNPPMSSAVEAGERAATTEGHSEDQLRQHRGEATGVGRLEKERDGYLVKEIGDKLAMCSKIRISTC